MSPSAIPRQFYNEYRVWLYKGTLTWQHENCRDYYERLFRSFDAKCSPVKRTSHSAQLLGIDNLIKILNDYFLISV
jgi:hypothetical protein